MVKTLAVLSVLVLISAMLVIVVRHQNRILFLEIQQLQARRDNLNQEWRQLLLEQGSVAVHAQVEQKARKQLFMRLPDMDHTIYVNAAEK